MSAVLKNLMPALSFYFPVFAARFGTDEQNIGLAMREYAERLDIHGVNSTQFLAGVEKLKTEAANSDYFPNPERFALMCKSALTAGMPHLQDVMFEIIQRRGVERHNPDYQFSHELCRLINERKGAMIYQLTSIEFERVIKAEYDHWAKRIANGEQLPQAHACLGDLRKLDLPDYLKNPTAPTCTLAKLAAQRSQGKA